MRNFSMVEIIEKKKTFMSLTEEEINSFISGYCSGQIPDYQAAALLMAICLNGMTKTETAKLTMAMANSGDKIDFSGIQGVIVDKHSSGGVGDNTTLVVAPLVAAAGIPVAKMSGRGLGHTGGTIDKLEAIKGFRTGLTVDELIRNVNTIGIALAGQTDGIARADKKLYALRDVIAAVNSIPLIASSIMSKKIACGARKIVLDVKVGSGAFMKDIESARELAEVMVGIGNSLGRQTIAILSDMDQPLGYAIGNALEVQEAIETLQGRGPDDLQEICLILSAHMLKLAGRTEEITELKKELYELLCNGKAYEKFLGMVANQGGDLEQSFWPAKFRKQITANKSGFVTHIQAEQIGRACMCLGAGREKKEDIIQLDVGIVLEKKVGYEVACGDVLATMFYNVQDKAEIAEKMIIEAISIGNDRPSLNPIVLDIIQ